MPVLARSRSSKALLSVISKISRSESAVSALISFRKLVMKPD